LGGETEVLGKNLPQRHFVQHKIPHDQTRAQTPDRSGGKSATNRLSYGETLCSYNSRDLFHYFFFFFFLFVDGLVRLLHRYYRTAHCFPTPPASTVLSVPDTIHLLHGSPRFVTLKQSIRRILTGTEHPLFLSIQLVHKVKQISRFALGNSFSIHKFRI
jgi:hypothetical protein